MNRKFLSTMAFMFTLAFASSANNLDTKLSTKEEVELNGVTKIQILSTGSAVPQTCTVTLSSWIKFGMMQIYYTVSASAETCAEAVKSANDQMNEAKSFLNYTIIE
ncbi:MAG: hypothetical protein SFV55_26560 [Haliscomenobacter sp.]|uniref:hypothetical protein n=1 Tax=Haliscomenobacter sp. TaxID=2717303 RepID=UPI0029ABEA3B|nr:hypothetical protein [Haliscomenobacter sp.]MDX2072024.1 hypothetical protein [Haliscomenobacter sp.]